MAKVLVTGATGFIGKRLIYQLLEEGHTVYGLIRNKGLEEGLLKHSSLTWIYGDLADAKSIDPFPKDLDAAYYLVHSMGHVVQNLIQAEIQVASNFIKALSSTKCRQMIYLGGIIENEKELSIHLRSRLAVEKKLRESAIPLTILRASIIIGSGSASYEIIRDLVTRLPVMIAPKWVRSYCQPIAIRDVLFYLGKVLLDGRTFHNTYDIGGPEALTFKQVLQRYAAYRGLRRWIIDVPLLTPKLSSYWLVLITSVRFSICKHLVESMKQSTRKLNLEIDQILPHSCIRFEEALALADKREKENQVLSTWMDAWDIEGAKKQIQELKQIPKVGYLFDEKKLQIHIPIETVKERLWTIGGHHGWYSMNWAWRIRGLIDQLVGGSGLNRGRRDPKNLKVGDSIDFWRVVNLDEKNLELTLYAEMKLPGEAWLQFKIDKENKMFYQRAIFLPKGLWGKLYWYCSLPFHLVIFGNMAKAISQKP